MTSLADQPNGIGTFENWKTLRCWLLGDLTQAIGVGIILSLLPNQLSLYLAASATLVEGLSLPSLKASVFQEVFVSYGGTQSPIVDFLLASTGIRGFVRIHSAISFNPEQRTQFIHCDLLHDTPFHVKTFSIDYRECPATPY